ncbi:hypothetical protein OAN307_c37460 [Octadecabacter antarcticus 307]|uniref:Copper resistance protein D domain-containing protein n=2 Tax=Octadecabacter TaxID=53945 RepID=M9RAI0_9RHOB|nr:hypothetical protein OAN307_c37460 [Octadecabacter antarcticus 307]
MFGLTGLAPIDGWALASIISKATGYGAALLAMGGPMFVLTFQKVPEDVLRLTRQIAIGAVIIGLAVLTLQFGVRAARISGMGFAGATDTMMLGLIWDSPLGTAALWRGVGLTLILAIVLKGAIGLVTSAMGAVLIATSYTFIGHSLGDPRWLLAGLLIVHLLAAAFWVAALAPLHRAVGGTDGAIILHRFGIIASLTVGLLVVVGTTFAWFMTGSVAALLGTAYGWTLLLKLLLVTGLMGIAALNKWRLVPALVAGETSAARSLRRSIRAEIFVVVIILIITATLTVVTTPPVNL